MTPDSVNAKKRHSNNKEITEPSGFNSFGPTLGLNSSARKPKESSRLSPGPHPPKSERNHQEGHRPKQCAPESGKHDVPDQFCSYRSLFRRDQLAECYQRYPRLEVPVPWASVSTGSDSMGPSCISSTTLTVFTTLIERPLLTEPFTKVLNGVAQAFFQANLRIPA
jgi:hypothetical protein